MGPVRRLAMGGEIGPGGPDIKPFDSGYNGNCVAAGVTENGHFIRVYNTRGVVGRGKNAVADQQLWQPHNWLAFVDMIRDDASFRDDLLAGNVTHDFGDVAHNISQHQKVEITTVSDGEEPLYIWRLYEGKRGDEGPDWNRQTIVLCYDHGEMTNFVAEVMAGGFQFSAEFGRDVRKWLPPTPVVHGIGQVALTPAA